MSDQTRALLCWSSGKDSAWTLHVLRRRRDVKVVGLLTTINEVHDRVAMHAVRVKLLEAQAEAVGLPVRKVVLPIPCSNEHYERAMQGEVQKAIAEGITVMAFGDIFLEDVRCYRERQLAGTGMTPMFPLWGLSTEELAREMIRSGLRARLTCVDPKQVPAGLVGRDFDAELLADLPAQADPCGERGEFHTFVYDGPMFCRPVPLHSGDIVERDGFVFADIF
jgi:uncharacterized protein (TIGR00290 family)